jgi:hypothetical protein
LEGSRFGYEQEKRRKTWVQESRIERYYLADADDMLNGFFSAAATGWKLKQ